MSVGIEVLQSGCGGIKVGSETRAAMQRYKYMSRLLPHKEGGLRRGRSLRLGTKSKQGLRAVRGCGRRGDEVAGRKLMYKEVTNPRLARSGQEGHTARRLGPAADLGRGQSHHKPLVHHDRPG